MPTQDKKFPKGTPNRQTRVRFNRFGFRCLQPFFEFSRSRDEIGRSGAQEHENVHFVKGIGWRLKAKYSNPEAIFEQATAGRPGTWHSSFASILMARQESLSGVTYTGGSSTSFPLRQKRIPAGGSWEQRLSADQSAFPGPSVSSVTNLDRVYISDSQSEPDDLVTFTLLEPGWPSNMSGVVAAMYCCGPASDDGKFLGFGQYALIYTVSGRLELYERGVAADALTTPIWQQVARYKSHPPGANKIIVISVTSNCVASCDGGYQGDTMAIIVHERVSFDGAPKGNTLIELLNQTAIRAIELSIPGTTYLHKPKRKSKRATQLQPIRMDARRSTRLMLNAFDPTYETSGTLFDGAFSFPFPPTEDEAKPLVIEAYCDRPSGTEITVRAFDVSSDVELTGTITVDDCIGLVVEFPLHSTPSRNYRIQFDFTGTTTKTPTLFSFIARRYPIFGEPDGQAWVFPARGTPAPALPQRSVLNVSINGPTDDFSTESMQLRLADLTADATQTRSRTGSPIEIDVEDSDGTLRSRIFQGIIASVSTARLSKGHVYPSDESYVADLVVAGQWARLKRALAPRRMVFYDTEANKPSKVTDALFKLFVSSQFPTEQIDVPDLPVRFFSPENDPMTIEPDTPIGDVIQQIASDYLGGWFTWDANAGDDGMWRFLQWAKPPYYPLLRFDPGAATAGRLMFVEGAYGTASLGQTVPILPMFRLTRTWEPPEGNLVCVIGGSPTASENVAVSGGAQMVQIAINVRSYNAFLLPDDDPNYPDPLDTDALMECVPIVIRDPSLTTETGINFVTRRIYDASTSARECWRFTSWLPLFIDERDALQTRDRPPRVGDMAQIKIDDVWTDFVVARCDIKYKKAHMMLAEFELVRTSRMGKFALARSSMDDARLMRKIFKAFQSMSGGGHTTPQMYSQNHQMSASAMDVAGLPEASLEPIQDLDPTSDTFGEFYYMAGYDPAP